MTYDEETRIYTADEGRLVIRKSDGKVMGRSLQLGEGGSIDNYEEREYTAEEIAALDERHGKRRPERPDRRAVPENPVDPVNDVSENTPTEG